MLCRCCVGGVRVGYAFFLGGEQSSSTTPTHTIKVLRKERGGGKIMEKTESVGSEGQKGQDEGIEGQEGRDRRLQYGVLVVAAIDRDNKKVSSLSLGESWL